MINFVTYWQWFWKGTGSKPGFHRLLNIWLLIHLLVGLNLALLTPVNLEKAANVVLLPLVGIIIGLSFAWAGNAQALLQSDEIDKLSNFHKGGFFEYVYIYQTAILIIIFSLVLWAFAGLEIFDQVWPTEKNIIGYLLLKMLLFALSSLTLRECWHVVLGTQWMLLTQREIRQHK